MASPGMMDLYRSQKNPNEYTQEDELVNHQGMTVYYWTLVLAQIAAAISTTTKLQSVFCSYGFPNCRLNLMFIAEVGLALAAIYVQPFHDWFNTTLIPLRAVLLPISAFFIICIIE